VTDDDSGFDAGPFSMMAVAAIEGHLEIITFAGKKYAAMKYLESGNITPLMVFGRGMVGFDKDQMLRLWVAPNKYERIYNGDWVVMLSRTEYGIMRLSNTDSLFSLMPNVDLSTPEGRLSRIAQQHTHTTDDQGGVSGYCVECDRPTPCPTKVWAGESGAKRDILATWDPADDHAEGEGGL